MDCNPSGSSVRGIFQVRILEWVVIAFSRGSSWPRDRTSISYVSCIGRHGLYPGMASLRKRLCKRQWAMLAASCQAEGAGSWSWTMRKEALVLRTAAQIEQDWLFWGAMEPSTMGCLVCPASHQTFHEVFFFSNQKCPCLTKCRLQEAYRRNAMFYRTPCHSRAKPQLTKVRALSFLHWSPKTLFNGRKGRDEHQRYIRNCVKGHAQPPPLIHGQLCEGVSFPPMFAFTPPFPPSQLSE